MATSKTKNKQAAKPKPKSPETSGAPAAFTTTDANVALAHFTPIVKASVPPGEADVCRTNIEIARLNLERGVDASRPHIADVQSKLPHCPIELVLELPALGLGFVAAGARVTAPATEGDIAARLEKLRPMRASSH